MEVEWGYSSKDARTYRERVPSESQQVPAVPILIRGVFEVAHSCVTVRLPCPIGLCEPLLMSPRDIACDHFARHYVVIRTLIRPIQIDEHIEQGLRLIAFRFLIQHPTLLFPAIRLYLDAGGAGRISISCENINAPCVAKRNGRDVAPPRQLCCNEILS